MRLEGTARDSVTRRLGARAAVLETDHAAPHIRRHQCSGCGPVWRQDFGRTAEPQAKLSRRALRSALHGLVVQYLTGVRIAAALAVSWNTANDAVLAEGKLVLTDDPDRLNGVAVIDDDMTRTSTGVALRIE